LQSPTAKNINMLDESENPTAELVTALSASAIFAAAIIVVWWFW